jgi:hypothetical protein
MENTCQSEQYLAGKLSKLKLWEILFADAPDS